MKYYVNENPQTNGDHEVHQLTCSFCPSKLSRIHLGDFPSCEPAVREARKHFDQVDGCYFCSGACHTS